MKKQLLILVLLLGFALSGFGQMTLAHHYAGSSNTEVAEVNLSRSGRKIVTMRWDNGAPGNPDTLFFYNPDYSFGKMIPCPHIGGYYGQYNFYPEMGTAIGVFYPSETLFNTDTFLEAAVYYTRSTSLYSSFFIINELGHIVDSITHISYMARFIVHGDTAGNYHAYVTTESGPDVYNLPGSLPCETCVTTSLWTARLDEPKSIFSQPIPNPSKDQVKIAFTLPDGVNMAELQVYDINGKRIKTYKVDNKFGFIMLDNSQLAAGTYLYNIVVDGAVSSTQKFVVVR